MRNMDGGLATTFRVLQGTDNESAVPVLIAALDSPRASIQEGALVALLARHSTAGGREILRRLHTMPDRWKEIIRSRHGRLTATLRGAVLSSDQQMCENACCAALWFREYDLVATLLNALEDENNPYGEVMAKTLLDLTGQLYEESAGAGSLDDRRDPRLMRRHVVESLEGSLKRFDKHKRKEVVEAFLLLARRENAILKWALQDSHHALFRTIVDVLSDSMHESGMQMLCSFLDDSHPPPALFSAIFKRTDLKFVHHLLHKIGRGLSPRTEGHLKRIRSIAWLDLGGDFFDKLDADAQSGAVRLVMTAGIPRDQAFATIKHVVRRGKVEGRREAARALADFNGSDANTLALEVLNDRDPQVQANVLGHLRRRGIPGILPRLMEMVDSPHAVVREAARENLDEFSFHRFLGAFDMLDDEVRRSTGLLVKKIDPETVPQLRLELESPIRTRRLRGLTIAQTAGLVESLEEVIIELLDDADHMVRAEAAAALVFSPALTSRQALGNALRDSSTTVREAAMKSLAGHAQFTG